MAYVALFYIPLIAALMFTAAGVLLQRNGRKDFAEGLCGPLALIAVGWTFTGSVVVAARYGFIVILADAKPGLDLFWRRCAVILVATIGACVFAVGIILLAKSPMLHPQR